MATMSVDAIRSALLQESLGRLGGAGGVKGLLTPTQTPLQAGLLGAMQQLQPFTGYTTTPTTFGQAIGAGLMGAAGGVQQQKESDLARALQGLKLYGDLKPDELTGKALEIKYYTDRGFTPQQAQDVAFGNIETSYDSTKGTWNLYNKLTGEKSAIGGPISGSATTTTTGGITEGKTTAEFPTEEKLGYGENFFLAPRDLTDQQIKNFKMDISEANTIMPLLDQSIEDVENLFGIGSIVKRGLTGVAGLTPQALDQFLISPEGERAKANYDVTKKKIISSFVNNDRVPMGEQNLIRKELLPDESSFFQDPQAAKIKLLELKDSIQLFSDQAKSHLSGEKIKETPKVEDTAFPKGSFDNPFILNKAEDIMNYKSGDFVFWKNEIIQVK
jgi:hypothetical protein